MRVGELAVAFGLQVLVGVLLVWLERGDPRRWLVLVGMVAFLASVVLLSGAVGLTPAYGPLVLLPVIWAALRSRRGELVFAIAGAAVVLCAPIVVIGGVRYLASGWRSGALLVVIGGVLGAAVLALVDTVQRQRDEASEMLAAQDALRQIATLVATGAEPEAVFCAVAQHVAGLFGGSLGGVVRFDGPSGVGEIVGGWSADGSEINGQTIDLAGTSAAARVYQTSGLVLIAGYEDGEAEPILERLTLGGAFSAPVANHRTFHERLRSEVERAARHGRALSLALFDLDRFKQINDTHGHQTLAENPDDAVRDRG